MTTPLIYVSHPYGGIPENLDRAEAWVAFFAEHFDALFFAPWVHLCRQWPDTGAHRERGLALDMTAIDIASGVIFVGGCMSPSMVLERDRAVGGKGKAKSYCVQNLTRYAEPSVLLADKHQMACQAQLFGRAS